MMIWTASFHILPSAANPVAAAGFLDEVEKCYGYLKNNPMMYSKCTNVHLPTRILSILMER
jgi:hypothetical protein